MRQSCQNHLFTRLLDFARKEYFVEDRVDLWLVSFSYSYPLSFPPPSRLPHLALPHITYLIKVKHQIQLTNIPKKRIQHLNKEMYRFKIRQLVVICIHARAEEEAGVPAVHNLGHVAEFDEVGLVFLVARGDEAVHLTKCQRRRQGGVR
jgi:hypothetical protein